MKVGDLVRWWNNGDLGAIIKDEGGGEYFVYFFNGVTSWCIKSEIIPVVKAQSETR
tara:strand:- start:572 stop:739 length:168 start_codon:yes stop_codon:yes gene_type:complete